jgi:Effector-associated domain 2
MLRNSNSTERVNLMTFVDALLAIPVIGRESGRQALLQQMRPEISGAVPYSPHSRHHVISLVTTCMNYQGGLDELLALVRAFEGESRPVRQLDATIARMVAAG